MRPKTAAEFNCGGGRFLNLALGGANSGVMNGNQKNFDSAANPFVHNGVTMVLLRLVSETTGAKVNYIARPGNSLIEINDKEQS